MRDSCDLAQGGLYCHDGLPHLGGGPGHQGDQCLRGVVNDAFEFGDTGVSHLNHALSVALEFLNPVEPCRHGVGVDRFGGGDGGLDGLRHAHDVLPFVIGEARVCGVDSLGL